MRGFRRESGDDGVGAAADAAVEFGGREGRETGDADAAAYRAGGGLGEAVEGFGPKGEEEKCFAGESKDEAVAPLIHEGGVGRAPRGAPGEV